MTQENELTSKLPTKEIYGQLIAILSNRRRDQDGRLIIGITEYELKNVLNHSTLEETRELMNGDFASFLLSIGLSLTNFDFISKSWYVIKSLYAAPIELKEDELAILGAFIMQIEKIHDGIEDKSTDLKSLVDYLITRDYFNEYKIKKIAKFLIDNGYLFKKKSGKYTYGPKTLIEINEEARKLISSQASELLF